MNLWIDRLLDRWVDFSLRRTGLVLGIAAILFVAGGFFASKLKLRSDFMELLPTDSTSVINLEAVKTRVASYSTLTVTVESPDLKTSMRFADALVEELHKMPEQQVKYVDAGITELKNFYKKNKHLYADLKDLEDFRDRLQKRIREETEDSVVESLDDTPRPKTDLKIDEIRAKYDKKGKEQDRYVDGYYTTPDKSLLAVFVRPPSSASNFDDYERLVDDVQEIVDRLDPAKFHAEMKVGFTGDIKTSLEERDALADDMIFITILSLVLIIGCIVVYYRSIRSMFLIGLPMLLGLVLAFTIGYYAIGYLNSATAFLSSIIAGNGINFMIMLAARYFEEIRARGPGAMPEALHVSVKGTFTGTIVAASAASVAYGSLVFAGFRGFRQFGIIGGLGMLLCWLVTFLVGPPLIAAFHRLKPLGTHRVSEKHRVSGAVGRLVMRWPRTVLVVALLMTAASVVVTIPFAFDPFEYDFRNLRNRESAKRGSAKLSRRVDHIFDLPQSPTPVVTDELYEVPKIKEAILDAPGSPALIGGVKTLQDFLPKDQKAKLAVLDDLRRMIDRKIDFLSDKDRKDIEEYRPPDDLREVGLGDIPETVARPFSEADGTRGRILFVYSHPKESLLDGEYLLQFADFLRSIEVDGKPLLAAGQPMVFADMIEAILNDGVKVTIASFLGVFALLVVAFRRARAVGVILVSVGLGTAWMIGFSALFDLKLNFLNFVVIPITLGIAVDYGANIWARYRMEGQGRIHEVLTSTGGAVVLSSLTTIFGYATLITSTNMALQSFGIIADVGEVTALAAAEIVMTAMIVWLEKSDRRSA
jgi:predicted RND superfamily exporter protein